MQEEISLDAKKIIDDLCAFIKVKNYREFAKFLGVRDTKVYGWIKNNNIGDPLIVLSRVPNINPEWLQTGRGSMFLHRHNVQNATGNSNVQVGGKIEGSSINQKTGTETCHQLVFDKDEINLIMRLRRVGGKIMIEKINHDLDKLEKQILGG